MEKYQRNGCNCAIVSGQYHGWECDVSGGECMFLYPDAKRCAELYGEGPLAEREEEQGGEE